MPLVSLYNTQAIEATCLVDHAVCQTAGPLYTVGASVAIRFIALYTFDPSENESLSPDNKLLLPL